MIMTPPRLRTTLLALICASLAACAGSDTTRFYALSAEAPQQPAAGAGTSAGTSDGTSAGTTPLQPAPAVGLTPVALPKYLDRPQLVTRPDANAVKLNEFDKWSEPLEDLFRRTLAADLSRLLGSERVYLMPVRRAVPIERLVDVRIGRFEADVDGAVTLAAQWQIYADEGARLLAQRASTIREPVSGAGSSERGREAGKPEAVVAAMSRAVARLAREIAAALTAPGV